MGPSGPQAVISWNITGANGTNPGMSPKKPLKAQRVLRDGKVVASLGAGPRSYVDTALGPGETHGYSVVTADADGDSPASNVKTLTTPGSPPPPPTPTGLPKLTIASVYPNDDSVVIKVVPVPGAADYIVFDSANPGDIKASGGNLLVEWNGYPVKGSLIVQALGQLAPHQMHHIQGMSGMSGMSGMGMSPLTVANGHGDPRNPLLPIAQSDPITPVYRPLVPTAGATQAVIDTFRSGMGVTRLGDGESYLGFVTNDGHWRGSAYNADFVATDPMFVSHTHGMWLLRPGMTPGLGPLLQQNATVTWEFLHPASIAGGKVAHFSIECDAHFPENRRRWWEIYAIPAGDQILNPENLDVLNNGGTDFSKVKPTTSGNLLAWMIDGQHHKVMQVAWVNDRKTLYNVTHTDWSDPAGASDRWGPCLRGSAEGVTFPYAPGGKTLNGDIRDLDLRHRFDIYLSQTRIRIEETDAEGVRVRVLDRLLALPLTTTDLRWVVTGKVYHPTNDQSELTGEDRSWYWLGPGDGEDMRHLDSALSEVLDAFPN